MPLKTINPQSWPRPKGYSNGVIAVGRQLYIAGQVGWDEDGKFPGDDFVAQTRKALSNIIEVLEAAGAGPQHMARMTWYVTDKAKYLACQKELGEAYRDVIGAHFPAMTAVEVVSLMENEALVEIEVTAVLPD